jgi:hypothetical protein
MYLLIPVIQQSVRRRQNYSLGSGLQRLHSFSSAARRLIATMRVNRPAYGTACRLTASVIILINACLFLADALPSLH